MWEFFDLFVRPVDAFISSLQMLREDVGAVMKIDAMIGRATRILNRSGNEQHQFPRCGHGKRGAGKQKEERAFRRYDWNENECRKTFAQREREWRLSSTAKLTGTQGVILSGGGAQAAYEVGVIGALLTGQSPSTGYSELDSGVLVGTSAGSINAALLLSVASQGPSVAAKYIEEVWMQSLADSSQKCSGIYRLRANPLTNPGYMFNNLGPSLAQFATDGAVLARAVLSRGIHFAMSGGSFLQKALELIDLSALISTESFYKLIHEKVCLDEIRRSNWKLKIIATNWRSGRVRIFDKEEMTDACGYQILLASSALPGFVPWVEIDGQPYVDGGVVMNTPLKPAIDAGADTLHVIHMDPDIPHIPLSRMPSTLEVLARSIEIRFRTAILQDIQTVQSVNLGIAALSKRTSHQTGEPIPGSRRFLQHVGKQMLEEDKEPARRLLTVHLYCPSGSLGVGWLNFEQNKIERLIRRGYEDAIQHDCKASHCILPPV